MTGAIPTWLDSLSELRALWLSRNRLTGPIPAELGVVSTLRSLTLSDNELTGAIPMEMGALANLEQLYLGGNDLAGCIPPALRAVEYSDLDALGLADCEAGTARSSGMEARVVGRSSCARHRVVSPPGRRPPSASLGAPADAGDIRRRGATCGAPDGLSC